MWRGFPWRKVPGASLLYIFFFKISDFLLAYIFAQIIGGIIGAGLVYVNYLDAIDIYEGGSQIRTQATAELFTTYAVSPKFIQNHCPSLI